jgi:hypothetical protein
MSGVVVVVGIGADGMAGLAEASRLELRRAAVIYGSPSRKSAENFTSPRGPCLPVAKLPYKPNPSWQAIAPKRTTAGLLSAPVSELCRES